MKSKPTHHAPPQAPVAEYKPPVMQQADDHGKTLGIICCIFAVVGLQLVGLILSIIGYNRSHKAGFKNTLAMVGIWLNSSLILLIVVVAIMAAFTPVAYRGITTRANKTKQAANTASGPIVTEISKAADRKSPKSTADGTKRH